MTNRPTVFIVDDDDSVRKSFGWLIESAGLCVSMYASAEEFLDHFDAERPGCLVLDVRMPGMTGLQLQEQLMTQEIHPPIIIVTGHGDVPSCVRAFHSGAFAFVEKPVNDQVLIDHMNQALLHDATCRDCRARRREIIGRVEELTDRERQIMYLTAEGKEIKAISSLLGISLQTAARHRSRVFAKMRVDNMAQLTRLMHAIESTNDQSSSHSKMVHA